VSAGRSNVDVVREIYSAWLEGRSARDLIAEDVEYVNPPDAVEGGTRRGRAAFRGIRDAYDDVRIEPLEYIETPGDDVLVIARVTGRGQGSGVEIDWRQGYIWTVSDGRAVRFRWFSDPEHARSAAGLQA
jgi:ketosteroid isomerase-like protein